MRESISKQTNRNKHQKGKKGRNKIKEKQNTNPHETIRKTRTQNLITKERKETKKQESAMLEPKAQNDRKDGRAEDRGLRVEVRVSD